MVGTCTGGLRKLAGCAAEQLRWLVEVMCGPGDEYSVVGPMIKEQVRSRKPSNALDIHTLMLCQDPGRSFTKVYKTTELLGRGGFGSVFRARHLPTGEDRAIKVVPKPRSGLELRRLLTEVELLIQLDHVNIEKFYEFFEDQKLLCLVTELCTGGNLGELDPTVDDWQEIRVLFRDVMSAVAYCHSEGVAHRDLKFENCLLTEPESARRRTAKVIDFGLSAIRPMGDTSERWMNEAVGTIFFVAPEVLKSDLGWSKYGPECDMWSIGVMLFIVLTDQHPFAQSAASTANVVQRIRRSALRVSPLEEAGVDPVIQDLIVRLLCKDPTKRLQARAALDHEWFQNGPVTPTARESTQIQMRTILNRVRSFAHFSRFERAVLTLVAHEAHNKEVEDLREAFNSLDRARQGWLTRDDFRSAVAARGFVISQEELAHLCDAIDPDGDDKIQYTDWLAATIKPAALTSDRAIGELFNFFDIHSEGIVSRPDLVQVLGEEMANEVLANTQTDEQGNLTRDQFRTLMLDVARHLQTQDRRVSRSYRNWLPHMTGHL
mmetsp:Transcript_25225/g.64105  ORF Transcript_25225/g.64105 Transcript_25225/m.64105 type:complete len:547 (+) Transcript_25225:66-1706(+)